MEAKKQLIELENAIYERQQKQGRIETFLQALEQQDGLLTEFDEQLWRAVIDTVCIGKDDSINFKFKG